MRLLNLDIIIIIFITYIITYLFVVPSLAGQFAGGIGPIWGSEINCTTLASLLGSDLDAPGLLDCLWPLPIGSTPNCTHSNDAGVVCTNDTSGNGINKVLCIIYVNWYYY